MAYVLGQILDVHVFNRLRQRSAWWVAPAAAMFFGNISDTLAFFFIAFYKSSDPFMANNWVEIALVDYSFKVMICLLFFPADVRRVAEHAAQTHRGAQRQPAAELSRAILGGPILWRPLMTPIVRTATLEEIHRLYQRIPRIRQPA